MKSVLTGTLATLVLGAAIASSQTPPAGQTPTTPRPSGTQTEPRGQGQTAGERSSTMKPQTTTYRGFLRGSEASGWTIQPIDSRAGATGTAGATSTSGAGAAAATYNVVPATDAKVNLASLADQCVEIVGSLAPGAAGAAAGGAAAGGAAAAGAGQAAAGAARAAGSMNRTLNVTSIKAVEGGCK